MYLCVASSFRAWFRNVPKISLLPTAAHHTTSGEDPQQIQASGSLETEMV